MSRSLAGFRTRGPFSGFGTEVSYLVPLLTSGPFPGFDTEVLLPACLLTSVLFARFQGLIRKFYALFPCRLPYFLPVFRVLDGSSMACAPSDFRTGSPFSGFDTEVSCLVPLPTSVPDPRFQGFGRKFYALLPCQLPYRRLVFRVWDGSFMACAPADFRTRALFSVF